MKNRTGAFVAAQRHAHQLTPAQLAVRAGYTNTSKGARRIVALERYGVVVDGLLDRLIDALDLDRVYFLTLVEDDRRAYEEAWERWADEPVAPELRFRALPAVWFRTSLPADISQPDAVTYAKDRAATTRLTHVLAWSSTGTRVDLS